MSVVSDGDLRKLIKEHLSSIKDANGIYSLFNKLNYPKKTVFDTTYVKKVKDFEFAKEEGSKVNKIYTVLSIDKLNVFLIEIKSLSSKSLIRYFTRAFSDMYPRVLLIFTTDYKEFAFVLPEYEKKEAGKHKLKTTTLKFKVNDLYYTDVDIISKLYVEDQGLTWRDIWRQWRDAFNVDKVTEKFFRDYQEIFFVIRKNLGSQKIDTKTAHEFTLQLLNRIMFIYFIAKKGWLNEDRKFMKSFWETYKKMGKHGTHEFYANWLQPLFFEAFNNNSKRHIEFPEEVNRILSTTPYLNGGLFKQKKDIDDIKVVVSDHLFKEIFDFFENYNFTIKEDSALDLEVSVDPQMIGYVYESLANVTEDVYEKEEDLRGDWGIFYTSKVEVDFMCKRSITEYLSKHTDIPKDELYEFVFDDNKEKVEKNFTKKNYWRKLEEVLDNVSIVDPACGSGAFLVGMLNVLVELYKVIYKYTGTSRSDYSLKLSIIQRSLYGVDVMSWAIHAAELRLWLQLIVETDFDREELRKHPLLPNLNMNLRIGDSLVQEIGGLTFNVRTNDLKQFLRKKLDELKQEKRNYFVNSPVAKYKTVDEIRKQEMKLFEEIIDERISSLETDNQSLNSSEKKHGKQIGLFGEVNIEAKTMKKEQAKKAEIESKIASNEEEINKLKKIKELLEDPENKPFVWDIDFAEVFSEKSGFDIVIGNPPYVRQEKIAPPNKLKEDITLEDRKEYKELLMRSVNSRYPVVKTLNKQSDLYIYFYFHGLSLLNPEGTFCFITSNSWLDVGYGVDLQEFLLKYCPIISIYDNQAKRSFAHADVNTIIALFGAPRFGEESIEGLRLYSSKDWAMLNNTARFVMFKKPFEEVINSSNLVKIEKAKEITLTEEYRVYPIKQEDLLEDGWEYPDESDGKKFNEGNYEANKWGGKYLKAPDIYFTLLNQAKNKFVKLKEISIVKRGYTTGANDFFYIDEDMQKRLKIEPKYLKPAITSPRESKKINLNKFKPIYHVLLCHENKNDLKGTNVIKYIEEGQKKEIIIKKGGDKGKKLIGYQNLETTKNRKNWYDLGAEDLPDLVWNYLHNDNSRVFFNDRKIFVNNVLYGVTLKNPSLSKLTCLLQNSTINTLIVNIFGRMNYGEGALSLAVFEVKNILVLNPENFKNSSKLIKLFEQYANREILDIFTECGIDPSKPIREQEPKPLPDRAELDNIVFDELGLTKEERKEVYWAVCELVSNRLNKANSLKKD